MAGWEGKTLAQARADAHEKLRLLAWTTRAAQGRLSKATDALIEAQDEHDRAARWHYDLASQVQAQRGNVEYLEGLPDDASPGDPPHGEITPERQAEILAGIDQDVSS